MYLDGKVVPVGTGQQGVPVAVVLAVRVTASGDREVLGCDVGPSTDRAFWVGFLRGLVAQGVGDRQFPTGDGLAGLKRTKRLAGQ